MIKGKIGFQHLRPGAKSEGTRHRPLQIGSTKEIAQLRNLTIIMAGETSPLGQKNVDELLHVMIGELKNTNTRRTPPRDDRRVEKQRSPPNSKFSNRDTYTKKRPTSPSKEVQPAKRILTHDAWLSGGKEAISQWSGVDQLRRTIRSLGLSDIKNMITRAKEANNDLKELFYRTAIPYHQRVNEESSKYLSLHKELGIPGHNNTTKRTVSLNFYCAKVLKLCYDHQNTMTIKEATDIAIMDIYEETTEHNKKEPNPYEHYDDSYILSSSISTLGEHTRERKDHKKAGFCLWLQKNDMLEYHRMRFEFFDKVFLKRDIMQNMAPLASFMSEEDVTARHSIPVL